MNDYIGIHHVKAKPSTRGEYYEDATVGLDDPGFAIVFQDGDGMWVNEAEFKRRFLPVTEMEVALRIPSTDTITAAYRAMSMPLYVGCMNFVLKWATEGLRGLFAHEINANALSDAQDVAAEMTKEEG